jgi:hypothetical protein
MMAVRAKARKVVEHFLEFACLPVMAHFEWINTTPRLGYHADMITRGLIAHSQKRSTSPIVANEDDPMLKLPIHPAFKVDLMSATPPFH